MGLAIRPASHCTALPSVLVSSLKCLLAQLRQEENLQLKALLRDVYNNQVGSALETVSASHGSLS